MPTAAHVTSVEGQAYTAVRKYADPAIGQRLDGPRLSRRHRTEGFQSRCEGIQNLLRPGFLALIILMGGQRSAIRRNNPDALILICLPLHRPEQFAAFIFGFTDLIE